MLRKCYEYLCNGCINTHMSKLATKSAIVRFGHQIVHCRNWAKSQAQAVRHLLRHTGANIRADKLEKAGLLLLAGTLVIITACLRAGSWTRRSELEVPTENYLLCGIVESINHEENYITIVDNSGNAWEWEGVEDWQENDIAVMMMNNNGTEKITDDIIMNIKYTGWVK